MLERHAHVRVPEADEPDDDGAPVDFPDEDEESPALVHGWLGAIGQMAAALVVVVAIVALFIGATVGFRWLLP